MCEPIDSPARAVEACKPYDDGLRPDGMTNSTWIEKGQRCVDVFMSESDQTATLEIPTERVAEFAAAARQIIDARLQAHAGECPDFWKIVGGLYSPELEEEQLSASSSR